MDVQKISNELATLKRAVKSAATVSLKEKLKNKIKSLEQVLKDANIPAKKLAMMLLGAKRKVASYTQAEFNAVIKRLSYKAEYSFLKGLTKTEVKDDLKREAKTPGWRFKGRDNFKIPTKKDLINDMGKPYSKRKTYYESRSNRSDVTRPALLETGGGVGDDYKLEKVKRISKFLSKDSRVINTIQMSKFDGNVAGVLALFKYKVLDTDVAKDGYRTLVLVESYRSLFILTEDKKTYPKKGIETTLSIVNDKDLTDEQIKNLRNKFKFKGLLNGKMALGGGVENDLEEEDFDLFEDFDNLPQDVQDIFFEYEDIDDTYERNEEMLSRLKPLGYTFDYGLDAVPFGLKKMALGGNITEIIKVGSKIKKSTKKGNITQTTKGTVYEVKDDKFKLIDDYGNKSDRWYYMHDFSVSNVKNPKMAHGGGVENENKEMVLNNAQQIEHHAEELENAARKAKHIPAWVVAKIYNASSSISDATHYLDGVNTMPKEQYERIHAEIENNKMETGGGLNSFLDMQMAVSKICKSNGCTIKDYYLAEKKYSAGGGIGGTFDSSSTGVGIGGTDSSSETGTLIGGTAASSMAKGGGVGREETQQNNFGKSYKLGDKFILNNMMSSKEGVETSIVEILSSGLFFRVDKSNKTFSIKTLHSKGSSYTSGQYLTPITNIATGSENGETCEIFDSNGERAIDNESIEKLTKCVTALPQTKSSNIDSNGNYTKERQKLHTEIINKFKKDVVCIKKGKPIAVLMGGSPASGKSTFLKKYRPYLLSDSLFKVDADEIRAELPEYKGWNATQTHEETGDIVDILISDRNVGIPCKFDFVFDGTMSSVKRYKILINNLRKEGYNIYIVFMGNIPKDVIKRRALERYKKSGRFVPMFVIEDFYANGEKNLKELKSMVDGYIVVDGSTYDYKIIEQGGKKLPNKRLYEKLGEKIQLKKGGPTKAQENKIAKVMHEWKEGELNIGKSDKKVKSQKQAVAIALSQAGLSKKETGGKMIGWKHKR